MSTELNMPQMGYDMKEGTVVRWLLDEGASVNEGDPIAEIETDKAVVEFESYATGLLRKILVPDGTTVPVGQAIAIVGDQDEEILVEEIESSEIDPIDDVEQSEPETDKQEAVVDPDIQTPAHKGIDDNRALKASPIARKLAAELGVDLSLIVGTGPGGRITKSDVLAIGEGSVDRPQITDTQSQLTTQIETSSDSDSVGAEQLPISPVDTLPGSIPLTRMRQQISRVTVQSKQEKPHFYISADVDMSRAMQLRSQINTDLADEGVKVTVNDLIIKACVEALKKHPKFNAYLEESAIKVNEKINIGVAVAEEEGLIVPAIMDCGDKSLRDIAKASKDLASRATAGSLSPTEYTGGTFAISNLGMFDVTSFAAIIYPPQTAMIAVGTVTKRPVVKDDQIVIADMMTATLSADHRVVDGAEGARFIIEVKEQLQNPLSMVV